MEIKINLNLISTLERLASERNVTTSDYIEKYVDSHLLSQYKQDLINKINNQKIGDVPVFESAVNGIIETIKTRDYIEPGIEGVENNPLNIGTIK